MPDPILSDIESALSDSAALPITGAPAGSESSPTDPFLSEINAALSQSESPVDRTARKEANASRKQISETLHATGGNPTPPLTPPPTGLRSYLRDVTSSLVDLRNDALLDYKNSTRGAGYLFNFSQSNAAAFDKLRGLERELQTDVVKPLAELTVQLNDAPPSPTESLLAIESAYRDWQTAASEGRLRGIDNLPNLSPQLVRQTFSKLTDFSNATDLHQRAQQLLRSDGPYGNEQAAYEALGLGFAAFARNHRQYYAARNRWERVLGTDLTFREEIQPSYFLRASDPDQPSVPFESPYGIQHLQGVSPFLDQANAIVADQAARRAQATTARNEELSGLDAAAVGLSEQGGAAAAAGTAFGALATGLEFITGGAFSRLYDGAQGTVAAAGAAARSASDLLDIEATTPSATNLEVASAGYQSLKSASVRRLFSATGGNTDHADELYEYILQSYPDAAPEETAAIAGNLYSGVSLITDWTRRTQQFAQRKGFFNRQTRRALDTLLISDPAAAHKIGALGQVIDDPADFLLTATGVPSAIRGTRRATAAARRSLVDGKSSAFDGATGALADLDADARSKVLSRTLDRVRATAPDADSARTLLSRVQQTLKREQLPITPEIAGNLEAATEALGRAGTRHRRTNPNLERVLNHTATAIADINEVDAFFILEGRDVIPGDPPAAARALRPLRPQEPVTLRINPALSADRAGRVRRFMEAQESADRLIDTPRATGVTGKRMSELASSVIAERQRLIEDIDRRNAATSVLSTVDEEIGARRAARQTELTAHRENRDALTTEAHATITEALNTARLGETQGVSIPTRNPALRTKTFATAESLLVDPNSADAFLRGPNGGINRRGLKDLGGESLVREIVDLDSELTEARKTTTAPPSPEARDFGGTGVPQRFTRTPAEIEADVRHRTLSAASTFYQAAVTPQMRRLGPPPKPRTRALEAIDRKLNQAIEKNELPQLASADIELLNAYRPSASRLTNDFAGPARKLDARVRELERLDLKDELLQSRTRAVLDSVDEGSTSIQIPAALAREVERHLDSLPDDLIPQYHLGRSARLQFSRRSPEAEKRLATWRSLKEGFTEEERLIRTGVLKASSIEYALAPPRLLSRWVRDEAQTAANLMNHEGARVSDWALRLDRTIDPTERVLIFESMRSGQIDPRLPADAAQLVLKEAQDQRIRFLQRAVDDGRLSPEKFDEFAGDAYYHGVYFDDPAVVEKLQGLAAARQSKLKGEFRPLQVDGFQFKFKRPNDSYWVAYSADGQIAHRAGFASLDEASEWANNNLDDGTSVSVHAPVRIAEKELEGQTFDPALSHLKLIERMARDESNYRAQLTLSKTPFVRDVDELTARGGAPVGASRDLFELDGQQYIRFSDRRAPHLNGRLVHADIATALNDVREGHTWYRAITDAFQESIQRNPLRTLDEKTLSLLNTKGGSLIKAYTNLWTMGRVALNPRSWARGWKGNLVYSSMTAVDPFTPSGATQFAGRSLRHLGELVGSRAAIKEFAATGDMGRLLARSDISDTWKDLIEGGQFRIGDVQFANTLKQTLDKHWTSLDALHRRRERMEGHLEGARAEFLADPTPENRSLAERLEAGLADLDDKIRTEGPPAFRRGHAALFNSLGNVRKELWRVAEGSSDANRRAWDAYSLMSGDMLTKAINYSYMREKLGLSKAEALARLDTFTQQLHKISEQVRQRSRGFGGAMFVGYNIDQLRILKNIARSRPVKLASLLGKLTAWNTASLASQGLSIDEYSELYATLNGYTRDDFVDTLAMGSAILIPNANAAGGIERISTGPLAGTDLFTAQGTTQRGLVRSIAGEEDSTLKRATDFAVGTASRFWASGIPLQNFISLATGRTPQGDPISGPRDAGWSLLEQISPSLTPGIGRDWKTLSRVLAGTEVDPNTFDKKSLSAFVSEALLDTRPLGGDEVILNRIMSKGIAANPRAGRFLAEEARDEMLYIKVARGAVRDDGSVDRAEQLRIIKDYYDQNATELIGTRGRTGIKKLTKRETLERALESTGQPRYLTRFSRQPLEDKIHYYLILQSHPSARDPKVDAALRKIVEDSIESSRPDGTRLQNVIRSLEYWQTQDLPNRAKAHASRWYSQLTRQQLESTLD